MTRQSMIRTARGFVDAFNANDWERCKAAMAPRSLYDEVGTSRKLRGAGQVIQAFEGWKEAMPNVKGTVTNAYATGDTAVLEVTWKGTLTGPWQGAGGAIPATGRKQVTRASWVMTFEDGRIKESRHYFDMLSFMQQLGVLGK